tara:strand:+ start:10649 stop:12040 length:1392 start_codon:yes stop_codon:yes gene_type:complete
MERGGGYTKNFHTVLHDACKVRAVVLASDTTCVAIVSVDALLIRRELVQSARKRIAEITGMDANAILVCATHSHSSGPTGLIYPGDFDHASPDVQTLAYQRSSTANPDYVKRVEEQIVAAVVEAHRRLQPCTYSVGTGREDKVSFNRRIRMNNGMTHTNPRPGNPASLGYAGPIDPDVGVIGIWNTDGKLSGCIVNFACHAVGSAPVISANYIYYIEQVIRGTFGDECVVVFTAGASGDVTPIDNLSEFARRESEELQRFVGGRVGAETIKVLLTQPRCESAKLGFASQVKEIARRTPSRERVHSAQALCTQEPADVGKNKWILAKEIVILDALIDKQPVADVEIQAIQVGPAILLANPAELFCELGLTIKQQSGFPVTFPVTLANGYVGYIPTETAFGPRGGGYETRLTASSNLRITAGTEIVAASVQLAGQLTPDRLPTRPSAPPYGKNAWELGAAVPELD